MKTTFSLVPERKLHTQLPLNNTLLGERSLKYQLFLKRISGCISCEFLGLNSAGTVAALCTSSPVWAMKHCRRSSIWLNIIFQEAEWWILTGLFSRKSCGLLVPLVSSRKEPSRRPLLSPQLFCLGCNWNKIIVCYESTRALHRGSTKRGVLGWIVVAGNVYKCSYNIANFKQNSMLSKMTLKKNEFPIMLENCKISQKDSRVTKTKETFSR